MIEGWSNRNNIIKEIVVMKKKISKLDPDFKA